MEGHQHYAMAAQLIQSARNHNGTDRELAALLTAQAQVHVQLAAAALQFANTPLENGDPDAGPVSSVGLSNESWDGWFRATR